MNNCRLYLISPPAIELSHFSTTLKEAFDGGDVGAFQLRLKNAGDDEIMRAAEVLMPVCLERGVAFILNDRPDLAVKYGADGVHLGQDDFISSPSPFQGEGGGEGSVYLALPSPCPLPERERGNKQTLADVRKMLGKDAVIGVSCHDSRHLAMEAGEDGADYVAFGAFYPTTSKSPQALARYGIPDPSILNWWQTYMVLPCVAIGGINPQNCLPLVQAGADFIAVIQAVWNHPQGAKKAVEEFNEVISTGNELSI